MTWMHIISMDCREKLWQTSYSSSAMNPFEQEWMNILSIFLNQETDFT